MSELVVEICPETGICSLVRDSAEKLDLMPDEVEAIRDAGGDGAQIKEIIADSDSGFAATLNEDDIIAIAKWVK